MTPAQLETQCEWTADSVGGEEAWTEVFTPGELDEIDAALRHAQSVSSDLLDIGPEDFPLPTLAARLKRIEHELIDGRGFVRLRGVPRARYDNDQMCLIYWGIGRHLGQPWAQNKHGHLLGDVTDQGKSWDDPTVRGNELGGMRLGYHCDGSDLVGLMCLRNGVSGGLSAVANSVALHNAMVRERPDLAAELYKPQPYDFRGEQAPGGKAWYTVPVFTQWGGRLFVRVISAYIRASQRHPDAPRLTPLASEALAWLDDEAESGRYSVTMGFEPGDMQFVNNFHVLHGRTAYVDDRPSGRIRHLKRLWLETEVLSDRPPYFRRNIDAHWNRKPAISRLDAVS